MGAADHDPDAFAEELGALKRRGCAILVINPPSGRERCEALLGETDRGRERVVVDVDGKGPTGPDRDVIDAGRPGIRSASAANPGTDWGIRSLDAIADDLRGRIDRLAESGLKPGELRVCLGDAETLAAHDEDGVERFFRTVTERVRRADGMAHAHLPVTSPVRDWIEPVFDVTVEVRASPNGRQQRWLLHDSDLDSGWLAIEDEGDG